MFRSRRKWRLLLLASIATAAIYVACSPPPGGGAGGVGDPGRVRYGVDVDAMSLDPRTSRNTTDQRVVDLVYDGLIRLDASLQPQPALAESWRQPDARRLLFTLRQDARFQDGTPVTADDVAFTYRSILDLGQHSSHASLLAPIESVTALDRYRVEFTLSQPFAPLLQYLEIGIVPRHLAEAGADLATHPVGSGRYRFVRWERGSSLLLEPNADHPEVSESEAPIEFVPIPDNTARAQALEAGDLGIVAAPLAAEDVRRLARDPRFRHRRLPGLKITYLNFNTRNAPLSDPALRQAVARLVDRDTISQQVFRGAEQAASSLLLPTLAWSYSEAVRQPAFDPAAARRLLAAQGWAAGEDGVLARQGQRLQLTISTHSEDSARIQAAEYIQHALRGAGFDARVSISDFPAFINEVRQGRYDVALLGWDNIVDPDQLLYEQLHSGGGLNWGGYRNAQLDALLQTARGRADQAQRAQDYRQAAQLLATELPYLVLTYAGFDAFIAGTVQHLDIDARGYLSASGDDSR